MFTPQEVSEKVFPRASFGGYNMVSVDEFLDTLTEDYTALYKDNAILKAKLKVLAEKVEEYRATEDAMRSTLLSAQRMAAQMVEDAQTEKDQVIAQMQQETDRKKATLDAEIWQQEQKLKMAQQRLSEFLDRSRELCANQAAFLETLPEIEMPAAADPVVTNTVSSIEKDILKDYAGEPAAERAEAQQEAPAAEVQETAAAADAVGESVAADFNLDDLKFGHNYDNLTEQS